MAQTVMVSKGQKLSCGKNAARATVALNWNSGASKGAFDVELDVSAFVQRSSGQVKSDDDFIFYNNPVSKDNAVKMVSANANKTEIQVDFQKIAQDVSQIAISLTIYDAEKRNQNFGMVSAISAQLAVDSGIGATFTLDKAEFKVETAIVVCEIYRYNNEWKFAAVGAGYCNGLAALCKSFGISTMEEEKVTTATSTIKPKSKTPTPQVVPASSQELSRMADSVMHIWKTADLLLRENSSVARSLLSDNPEIFDTSVFVSTVHIAGAINIDRNTVRELLDTAFDKLNFIEIQIGSLKTDATCLYCVIITTLGKLLSSLMM
ncbi:MAG: TerD family protein [Clostridiales Family XIII bacterium]|jgi:tellurium resistance protein TerD|nr:TerD family protein [Clostridiales Family XIII bacterium]